MASYKNADYACFQLPPSTNTVCQPLYVNSNPVCIAYYRYLTVQLPVIVLRAYQHFIAHYPLTDQQIMVDWSYWRNMSGSESEFLHLPKKSITLRLISMCLFG